MNLIPGQIYNTTFGQLIYFSQVDCFCGNHFLFLSEKELGRENAVRGHGKGIDLIFWDEIIYTGDPPSRVRENLGWSKNIELQWNLKKIHSLDIGTPIDLGSRI